MISKTENQVTTHRRSYGVAGYPSNIPGTLTTPAYWNAGNPFGNRWLCYLCQIGIRRRDLFRSCLVRLLKGSVPQNLWLGPSSSSCLSTICILVYQAQVHISYNPQIACSEVDLRLFLVVCMYKVIIVSDKGTWIEITTQICLRIKIQGGE